MGKLNKDNLRKTVYYLKKNGLKNTVLAAAERLQKKEYDAYTYVAPAEQVLQAQRQRVWENPVVFSIVVPVYHTPDQYFCEMVESVLNQTYPYFELILADAGEDESLKAFAEKYADARIRYIKLPENAGIAENTNRAIMAASGDYIALFDHDDLLTADALYEMADARIKMTDMSVKAVEESAPHIKPELTVNPEETVNSEKEIVLLYSDEDKCDGTGSIFYDPNFKLDYDPDLLLTNNYFCHLTVVKADVAKKLLLRKAYDGAQDFDFVLRVTAGARKEQIVHVPKVLYHWRCHIGSTAANPESKRYAYESGKRAVEDYVNRKCWNADVTHLKHLGFYRVNYREDIFQSRPEIGAVGGRILGRSRKIAGGMMDAAGKVLFEGLRDGFSGYVNRAALQQQAEALDIRCMQVNPACVELCREVVEEFFSGFAEKQLGLSASMSSDRNAEKTVGGLTEIVSEKIVGNNDGKQFSLSAFITSDGKTDWKKLPKDTDFVALSLRVSRALRAAGYVLLWDPEIVEKI